MRVSRSLFGLHELTSVYLVAGSVLVGGLWIEPVTGDLYAHIVEQAQSDAAAYGALLFWPGTVILACLCGSFALIVARARKRVIVVLDGIGLALVVAPYVLTANSGVFWLAPLRGWQAGILIALLLTINVCAIAGAWQYVLRRRR